MKKSTFLSLCLFYCTSILFAQKYTVSLHQYTLEEGLSHNQINWLHKDKHGMLWVGTFNGINRYDGQAFKYVAEADFVHVDNSNILEDEEGDLWLIKSRESSELFFFNTITEQVKTFEEKFGANPPFQKEEYRSGVLLANQTINVSTKSGDLVSFSLSKEGIKRQNFGLGNFEVHAHPNSNKVWIIKKGKAIFLEEDKSVIQSFEELPVFYSVLNVTAKNHLIYRGQNNIIYLLKDGQTMEFDLNKEELIDYGVSSYHLAQDSSYIFETKNGRFNIYDLNLPDAPLMLSAYFHELEVSAVSSFLEDGENFWLGTINGLFKIQVIQNKFKKGLYKDPKLYSQNNFNSCRGMIEDEKGNVYVSAKEGVFSIKDDTPLMEQWANYSFFEIFLDKDQRLWSSYNGLNFQNDLNTGKQFSCRSEGIPFSEGWSYFQDHTGRVWCGTPFGLTFYEEDFTDFKRFEKNNDFTELRNNAVYDFFVDQQNLIWIASSGGLYLLDLEEGIIDRYWEKGEGAHYFPSDKLQQIHQDEMGIFWIASREGLIRWDKEKSATRLFTLEDGLSNNNLNALYEDDFGFLWMSSDNGIIQFQKETFKVKNYKLRDGITHSEFNRVSHYQDTDGNIYFGGLNGVTYFHPKDFVESFSQPVEIPLRLTECKIFSGEEGKQEDRFIAFHDLGEIMLKPGDRYLMLQFALLDYYNSKTPQYVYEIDGEAWRTTKENVINISALPYGDHTLTVKARTGNGVFSTQNLSIPIKVLKPFYLQWWFIGLSLLALASLIISYQKNKTKRLLQRQEELETTVAERTQTIQQQSEELLELDQAKSRFLANISHELRTPLTLILNTLSNDQVEKILSNQTEAIKYIYDQADVNIMQRNAARLQQLIDQLLDLSKLEANEISLKASQEDFKPYVEEIVKTFQTTAQKKNIQLTFESAELELPLYFERDKMDKVLYNLIANAIKFTPEAGKVAVKLWQEEKELKCMIKDNGIGIPTEDLENIFNRFYQVKRQDEYAYEGTGLGLALVKELIEIHDGQVEVSSGLGIGTCFTITLPLGAMHLKAEEKVEDELFLQAATIQKVGEQALETQQEAVQAAIKTSKPILLVIEDNEDLRYHHQKRFGQNYQVILAQNGNEGLEKAFEIIPDIIICDVMMPGKNGYEVCQSLKTDERTNHIPLVLLTAKVSHLEKMEGLTVGADDYITKPYDQQELKLRLRNLLEHTRQLQKQFSLQQKGILRKTVQSPQDKFIQKLSELIEANITNRNFGVSELSDALFLSRSQLFRKLKALTGNTPNNFLRTYRLNRAKELLLEEDGNATNVSYLVGFNNPNYFFKCFKDEFGMTPGQFMEQQYKE